MPELQGRRDMTVSRVFSLWYDKHRGSSSLHLSCMTTLIKALVLTKGLGYLVSGLKPMCKLKYYSYSTLLEMEGFWDSLN